MSIKGVLVIIPLSVFKAELRLDKLNDTKPPAGGEPPVQSVVASKVCVSTITSISIK